VDRGQVEAELIQRWIFPVVPISLARAELTAALIFEAIKWAARGHFVPRLTGWSRAPQRSRKHQTPQRLRKNLGTCREDMVAH